MAEDTRETANVYTEAQHFALLESAVERETASLTEAKGELDTQVAGLTEQKSGLDAELASAKAQIDVLEGQKASAEAALTSAQQEFEDYKTEQARVERVAQLKVDRVDRVKAANGNLADSYYTDERIQRWAEMADESFDSLVADMSEAATAVTKTDDADATEQARQTAAFTGGDNPTAGVGSTFAQFLTATGRAPAVRS